MQKSSTSRCEKALLDVKKALLDVEKALLDVEKVLLDVEKVLLEVFFVHSASKKVGRRKYFKIMNKE